jgi:hypothetical protein
MESKPVVIPLNEEDVRNEYDKWIGLTQCESYAMTFLAKHPECIGKKCRELGTGWQLAGIEVWLAPKGKGNDGGKRADLVFTRESVSERMDYLVVEAEDDCTDGKISHGWDQVTGYARLLEAHLRDQYPTHNSVLAAVAAIDYPPRDGSRTSWTCGKEVPE